METKRRRGLLFTLIAVCGMGLIYYVGDKVYHYFLSGEGQYEGRPTTYWIRELKEKDPKKRMKAAAYLGFIGSEAKEAVPALCRILQEDTDHEVRSNAALALYHMGRDAKGAVPTLIHGLKDDFVYVRMNCALALAGIGPEAEEAVPALMEAFEDPENREQSAAFHFSIRQHSVLTLGKIGTAARYAIPVLIGALEDEEVRTRYEAARAL